MYTNTYMNMFTLWPNIFTLNATFLAGVRGSSRTSFESLYRS
jgi:hypothetical protein